ncbi:hypothetical protein [Dyadobacter luteus]|nr:hypothetical protein [Dyadobacter luteus]
MSTLDIFVEKGRKEGELGKSRTAAENLIKLSLLLQLLKSRLIMWLRFAGNCPFRSSG